MKRNLTTLGIVAVAIAVAVYINRLEPDRAEKRKILNEARRALDASAPPPGHTVDGAKFLMENAQREGVTVLQSGLQYEVLREGTGEQLLPYSRIKMHYRGSFLNGNAFDSTYAIDKSLDTSVAQGPLGWRAALAKMKVGDKWKIYLPPVLAYGEQGRRPLIPPNSMLIYEIEVLEILGIDEQAKRSVEKFLEESNSAPPITPLELDLMKRNAENPEITVLPSGLQYKVIRKGTGSTPKATDQVSTHYRGTFASGAEFDSSYSRGQPTVFPVNRVIPAWTEALQLMQEGAKWQLFVPPHLGYGARGSPPTIPPNAVLIFEIELIEIVRQ